MKTKPNNIPIWTKYVAAATCLALVAGCATPPAGQTPDAIAAKSLQEARSTHFAPEARVGHYLDAAALTAPRLGSGKEDTPARETYNAATAELTEFLKTDDGGKLWNHPETITSSGGKTYHLRFQPASSSVWASDYFTKFENPKDIKRGLVKTEVIHEGVGGALVGVRTVTPQEPFAPHKGMAAAVTSTVDFHGSDAVLTLHRPSTDPSAQVQGKVRPLEANFSAPISYFRPPNNLLLFGMMGTLSGGNMMERTGLYFLEPYDPNRIPVVFVHGLASTPFTWVKTITGLQQDPEIRKRYQPWVFSYATGNPILYSALRLREELARADKLYPNHKPYVVVGHSMGGMLTHDQVINVTEAMWERDKNVGQTAKRIFANNSNDSLVVRALTFQANPRIKRVVFVCTPHRGSVMATSGIGRLGISLIKVPFTVARSMTEAMTNADISQISGSGANRLPNSVSGLKPTNPTFPVVNSARMTVPYHSIIGDRGKGDSPNSTDGVVAYWSSHLDGAKSEKIVPGPHGSCELPETIAELDRILKLHLKNQGG